MDNKTIKKKTEIAEIVNIFKQNFELKSSEIDEKRLKLLKKCIERNEKIVITRMKLILSISMMN